MLKYECYIKPWEIELEMGSLRASLPQVRAEDRVSLCVNALRLSKHGKQEHANWKYLNN